MGTTDSTRSTSAFTDGLRALADVLDQAGIEDRLGYTHLITRFAPDAPTVEIEEDVVRWVCPPSLLAEARS